MSQSREEFDAPIDYVAWLKGVHDLKEYIKRKIGVRMSSENAFEILKSFVENAPRMTGPKIRQLAFMVRLKNRQGTKMPDFAAFYRARNELDSACFKADW